jgi:hypothetical protein
MAGDGDGCVDTGVHVGGMGWCGGAQDARRVPGVAQHDAKRNDALQTRDRCGHRLREGPGSAAHHSPSARAAPRPGHTVALSLSARALSRLMLRRERSERLEA